MSSVRAAVVGALALSACVASEEPSTSVTQQYASCPSWQCGSNSPVIASVPFWELNRNIGVVNDQGFTITKFKKGSFNYTLSVSGGRLRGTSSWLPSISGQGLVNSEIWLKHKGVDLIVKVLEVTTIPYFAKADPTQTAYLEAYRLYWNYAQPPAGTTVVPWQNLCAEPTKKSEWLTTRGDVVVLFEGERFDATAKTIYDIDVNWFNLGCIGHTLAKMHLTGHTRAAQVHGFVTTLDERQAMLKMLSADYCGDGTAYTVAGVPLSWQDHRGWMKHSQVTSNPLIEARWTKDGATCLHKPRVNINPTTQSEEQFPDGVAPTCVRPDGTVYELPDCTNMTVTSMDGAHLVSASPLPQ